MPARHYPSRISKRGRVNAMINRIHFCTDEMFATLTAPMLAAEWDVPLAVAEEKLAAAREGRTV